MIPTESNKIVLNNSVESLVEAFTTLHWAVVEDKPGVEEGSALLEIFEVAVEDAVSLIEEIHRASPRLAAEKVEGLMEPLVYCQEKCNKLLFHFFGDLYSHDRLQGLARLRRDYPAQWSAWVDGVEESLVRCAETLFHFSQALLEKWQSLANCFKQFEPANGRIALTPEV